MKKYLLEITVFICGAVVMIFELVGSRVLGPYLGTSIFVWTSLIGIILGSLSLGYYLGGKISDKKADLQGLSIIILFSSIFITLTLITKFFIINTITGITDNLKISSFITSIVLFSPASILLGIISPYVAKLKIKNITTCGTTVGNLYALSTAGSIFGTFLAGFFLIPFFGTNNLLILLSLILIIISIIIDIKNKIVLKLFYLFFLLIIFIFFKEMKTIYEKNGLVDIDTNYNRVWIYDSENKDGKKTRSLLINNENSSSIYKNSDELVYEYTKYYDLAKHFYPNFKNTLMLGGAGYSYPKHFLNTYPNAKIDVVEIDPKMTEIAINYFFLKDNKNLKTYNLDGRIFLNNTKNKYDVIFGDAFSSHHSLPYQLTTKEAIQKKYDVLTENGIVILNIISAIDGEKGNFLQAEYKTYKSVFPQVYIFPVKNIINSKKVQNIILVAMKSKNKPVFYSNNQVLNDYLSHLWNLPIEDKLPILTDDYAPVDYYISKTI